MNTESRAPAEVQSAMTARALLADALERYAITCEGTDDADTGIAAVFVPDCDKGSFVSDMRKAAELMRTIAQPEQEQEAEPIGWVYQHEDTGRMTFCENDGINTPETFQRLNPRHVLCGPAYVRCAIASSLAEQPAKGDVGSRIDAWRDSGERPETWDAVDEAMLCWYGHAVTFSQHERQRFYDAIQKYLKATPPTAQRHDEGALPKLPEPVAQRHAASYTNLLWLPPAPYEFPPDGMGLYTTDQVLAYAREAIAAHGAGASVEAVDRLRHAIEGECEGLAISADTARAILSYVGSAVEAVAWEQRWQAPNGEWSRWIPSIKQCHDEKWPMENAIANEHRALYTAPPQQRSEQAPRKVFSEGMWIYTETGQGFSADDLDAAAFEVYREAALSTQPLLSDQAVGVSNELRLAGTMLANCAFNLAQRPHLTDDERRSLDESRRAWDAALHPDQAKDGAAG